MRSATHKFCRPTSYIIEAESVALRMKNNVPHAAISNCPSTKSRKKGLIHESHSFSSNLPVSSEWTDLPQSMRDTYFGDADSSLHIFHISCGYTAPDTTNVATIMRIARLQTCLSK